MSAWTHVNASFRIDSFHYADTRKQIEKVFGKPYTYEKDVYYRENKKLPMGSEGGCHLLVWELPHGDEDHSTTLSGFTVLVFGDLRDCSFDYQEKVKEWFNNACKQMWIRQAVCEVVTSYGDETKHQVFVFEHQDMDDKPVPVTIVPISIPNNVDEASKIHFRGKK